MPLAAKGAHRQVRALPAQIRALVARRARAIDVRTLVRVVLCHARVVDLTDNDSWGPRERLRDPRTPGIAFAALCTGIVAAMFARGGILFRVVGIALVLIVTIFLCTQTLPRWRDRRFRPLAGALVCAAGGMVILAVALIVKVT
jgi:hypothetical protein